MTEQYHPINPLQAGRATNIAGSGEYSGDQVARPRARPGAIFVADPAIRCDIRNRVMRIEKVSAVSAGSIGRSAGGSTAIRTAGQPGRGWLSRLASPLPEMTLPE